MNFVDDGKPGKPSRAAKAFFATFVKEDSGTWGDSTAPRDKLRWRKEEGMQAAAEVH